MNLVVLLIIIVTVYFSVQGFRSFDFKARFCLYVDGLNLYQQYYRLVSSGFLHADWLHLGLNMLVLYLFSGYAMMLLGPVWFLALYFGAMIGGNLLAWLANRQNGWYKALGASGAVSGLIFALIARDPHMQLLLWFIPMPGWAFGMGYVALSIYGAIRQRGSGIGHEAHLGGALVGLIAAMLLFPESVKMYPLIFLAMVVPIGLFLVVLITHPEAFLVPGFFKNKAREAAQAMQGETRFDSPQDELDHLLDKVGRKGINSLSEKERKRLDELSANFPEGK